MALLVGGDSLDKHRGYIENDRFYFRECPRDVTATYVLSEFTESRMLSKKMVDSNACR